MSFACSARSSTTRSASVGTCTRSRCRGSPSTTKRGSAPRSSGGGTSSTTVVTRSRVTPGVGSTIGFLAAPVSPASTLIFAAAMGMMWLGVIPLVSGYVADLFGTRNMATLLGVSFVVHQMGSVIGAWGGGMIFDLFGNYDLAWRFGVSVGIVAGLVQILFGGPSGTWSSTRPAPAAG